MATSGNFIYPRIISAFRIALEPASAAASGPLPYQEAQARAGIIIWDQSPFISGVICSIQEATRGQMTTTNLPGGEIVPFWRIYFPLGSPALGVFEAHDFILDDNGAKYQVSASYWDSLGYRLFARTLEA